MTPMFPLGTVLLPGMPLPLRIFEARYQLMLADALCGDGTFGVVLIERGNEVGGGDTRTGIGTLAQITEHREMAGGQHVVLAIGVERIRVDRWLDDDPYPRADVSLWPEVSTPDSDIEQLYLTCTAKLRRLLAIAVEMGNSVGPATFAVPDDPISGSFVVSAITPVGPFDKQRLLGATTASTRLSMLTVMLDEQLELLAID